MRVQAFLLLALAIVLTAIPSAGAAPASEGLGLAQVVCLAQAGPWQDDENADYAKNCAPGKALLGANDAAVSADGKNVYVTAWDAGSLVSYARSGPLGQLRQIGCVTANGTNGIDGTKRSCTDGDALAGASNVALSPDGRNIYVSAWTSNAIAIFTRDPETGKVTQTGCVKGISTCTGARGLGGASDVVVSPDGRNVYLASSLADAVVMFGRDPSTGALKGLGCISDDGTDRQCVSGNALRGAQAVAISRDGKSVYVAAADSNAVLTFERNADTGLLTQTGCAMYRAPSPGSCTRVRGLAGPSELALAPDDRTLFVTALESNGISVFARDKSTGTITQRGCVTDPTYSDDASDGCVHAGPMSSPADLAVTADGRRIFVVGDGGLIAFDRDMQTGGLVKAGCVIARGYDDYLPKEMKGCIVGDGVAGAVGVAVSPDARNVYLAASWSNALSVLAPAASLRVVRGLSAHHVLRVRVSCPVAVGASCGGRVTVSGGSGRAAAKPVRYSLAPGAARTMLLHVRVGKAPLETLVVRAYDRRAAFAPLVQRLRFASPVVAPPARGR